ncbi:hypothetical protein [Amycolatopsis magusensis]|uniref:hypothetical protein n=1 Tax=Amycolatopsis magusensis TaxID=882444 RepID=UPI0037A05099
MDFTLTIPGTPQQLPRSFEDMGKVRAALVQFGMAFESPAPEFPESDHLTGADYCPAGLPRSLAAVLYERARLHALTEHGDFDDPAIPSHKLASADGWRVTAGECAAAVTAFDAARMLGLARPAALDDEVVAFLRAAAALEGCRV